MMSIELAVNQTLLSAASLLAPLGDYGGLTPTSDQRGASRPSGSAPDIASVEAFHFRTIPLVDTDGDGACDRMELG